MQTCKRTVSGAFAALLIFSPAAMAGGDQPPYSSATEAYRQGTDALKSEHVEAALPALEYAAQAGVLGAQLKLARLYAAGRDVPKDDAKAFFYFRQIASQQAEINPASPVAKYVGEAFVALGRYYVDGIQANLAPDPAYATSLFRHAASYFGNAEAQYRLGRLYLDGKGVERNPSLAVNWLAMSAKKQHAASQAVLGEMLWRGDEVRQNRARGLALLALAHENAKGTSRDQDWIGKLYQEAFAKSDNAVRKEAEALLPRLGGDKKAATIAKAKPSEPVTSPVAREAEAAAAEPMPAATPAESIPLGSGAPSAAAAAPLSVGFGASPAEH